DVETEAGRDAARFGKPARLSRRLARRGPPRTVFLELFSRAPKTAFMASIMITRVGLAVFSSSQTEYLPLGSSTKINRTATVDATSNSSFVPRLNRNMMMGSSSTLFSIVPFRCRSLRQSQSKCYHKIYKVNPQLGETI